MVSTIDVNDGVDGRGGCAAAWLAMLTINFDNGVDGKGGGGRVAALLTMSTICCIDDGINEDLLLHLGSLRLKAFFNTTCQPKSVSTKRIFHVLREINSDVAKKATMESDSVVVRIVRQVLFLREADGY